MFEHIKNVYIGLYRNNAKLFSFNVQIDGRFFFATITVVTLGPLKST